MLLFIDNFDSFTFNIVHAFRSCGIAVEVVRNDKISVKECLKLSPDYLVIGPGPGSPIQAGICNDLISAVEGRIPLLGICLGHQCIGEAFGGKVIRAKAPMHGKTSFIHHSGKGVFSGLDDGFTATRYHSLVVERGSLPDCLEITAETSDGEIMGLRHRKLPIEGVQFHPESIMTEGGVDLFKNFLFIRKRFRPGSAGVLQRY